MIAADGFQGKSVGVFGLARSGLSAARALKAGGAKVLAWDDKETVRLAAVKDGVALQDWESWPWETLSALVLSPGIPFTHPDPHAVVRRAQSHGIEVIGDLEVFARTIRPARDGESKAPIIAVTGTNGKSTTTALIGHVLQACGYDAEIGGNIGRAALDLAPPQSRTVYVLEVSSYQADLAPGLVPDIAVLTNLSPDHIERHGSMERYAAVKEGLLARTAKSGLAAAGVDDPYSKAIYTKLSASRGAHAVAVSVGRVLGRGVFVVDGKLYDAWDQPAAVMADLKGAANLPGAHNWQNAALAYAAVRRLVRDARSLSGAILRFPGLAHRIEQIGRIGNIRFVNDSKATNADAAARALACFSDIFWIAGGKPKEGGIESLGEYFPRIRKAYLIGEAAEAFAKTLSGRVDVAIVGTLDRAVKLAVEDARKSDAAEPVVLLSPACASFDQFRDFEQRGDNFREQIHSLMAAQPIAAQAAQKGAGA